MTIQLKHPRARQRWGALLASVALISALFGGAVLAVHDIGEFELDKNATNNLDVTPVGYLNSNINSTVTSINVCRTATGGQFDPIPVLGDTILIRAERMTITTVTGGSFGGNCAGTKVTYGVTRGVSPTAASAQSGGANNIGARVSLIKTATKDGPDWSQVHQAWLADPDTTCAALGLVECTFVADGIGPTTFTGGNTKDHLPISGWRHTSGASPDKGEILNAYAAKAIDGGGDQILYFGMDRYAVDGSTDIGFWFFQREVAPNADGTFSGEHVEGDILILGTFTQGGATSNIRVFKWVDEGGNEQENIEGPTGAFGDCVPGVTDDDGCATVNNTTIEVPWTYTFKGESVGGWVPAGGFFEGGVNLTDIGLAGCFSSFLAETRSSPEITAILKDFALGAFEACDTDLTTTPSDDEGTALTDSDGDLLPDIEIGTGTAGVDVTDSADLDIQGTDEWSGTLDFYICGPIASGTCDTGGLLVSSHSVDQDTVQPIVSDSANLTSVGRYCWRGYFTSETDGVPDAEDSSLGECFEVLPVTPTLTTQAVDENGDALTGAVPFGDPLYDLATLSGTAYQPGTDGPDATYPSINATMDTPANGTITFTLVVKDDDCATTPTTATGTGTNPQTVDVTGDDDYMSAGFTPGSPGDYTWQASYDGDSPNTLGTSHNDDCDETAEDVTVQQLQPAINTAQNFVPNDSATITVASGGGDLAGSVVFKLYVDDATCAGTAAYTSSAIDISTGTGTGLSRTVVSDNTTAYSTTGTTFHWVVEFTSTNAAHLGVTSGCGVEHSSITIENAGTP